MLSHYDWERYITTTAHRADMRVCWEEDNNPRCDGKTIWLPRMTAATTEEEYMRLRHCVTHEVEHALYSDFAILEEKGIDAENSFLGLIWNCMEDARVEHLGSEAYEGDRQCHDAVNPGRILSAIKNIRQADQGLQDKILPLLAWSNQVRSETLASGYGVQSILEGALSEQGKEVYNKFLAHPEYKDVLRNASNVEDGRKGTTATYELSKRIYEEVYGEDAKKEEERCKKEQQEEQKGKGGKAQKGEGKEGEDKAEGSGKGKGEGDDSEDQEEKIEYVKYMPDGPHTATPNKSMTGLVLEYPKDTKTGYTPPSINEIAVDDLTKKPNQKTDNAYVEKIHSAVSGTSPAFAHKVRTILQVRDKDQYHYGLKRGKLNIHQLSRVVMDVPGYSERVFKRKQVSDVLDAAVSLVVDQSGSMAGHKFAHAAAAAVLMSEVIGNTLHIPVEIVGFTANGPEAKGSTMTIHRNFSDRLVSKDVLVRRFAMAGNNLCNNLDGEAILWAFDRLIKRTEKRKLMIVFSDGQPAGIPIHEGSICWYTKKIIKEIETISPVDIVGVGLITNSVKEYYKHSVIINHANELEHSLLSIIESKLK